MKPDICVPCGDGLVNVRVGAVIARDGKLLMVSNPRADYCYSVGGRIKFGETAREAVEREVLEETGVPLKADRLAFVHENYFYGDAPGNLGKLIYELSFFFLMQVPDRFEPVSRSFTEDNSPEYLCWVAPDTEKIIYPGFFRTDALNPRPGVQYFITDERKSSV